MSQGLCRIVYCSRSLIVGKDADVTIGLLDLLAESRRNNPRRHVTGALLFHAGMFAQAVEGPESSVQQLLDAVQRDWRNKDVTVALRENIETREFPEWAMAFAGVSAAEKLPGAAAAFEDVFAGTEGAGETMLSVLKSTVVRDGDWFL